MFQQIKYSFLGTLRNKEHLISSLAVSILMGTVLHFITGVNFVAEETTIPVAIVNEGFESEHAEFVELLSGMDLMTPIYELNITDAMYQLESGAVDGIFEVGADLRLIVAQSGLNQRILAQITDEYLRVSSVLTRVAVNNPEYLEAATNNITNFVSLNQEMELASGLTDPFSHMTFMLIALTSLMCIYQGFEKTIKIQDGSRALSGRRQSSVASKVKMLVADLIGLSLLQFVYSVIVWAYFVFVMNAPVDGNLVLIVATLFIGCLFATTFGAFFGIVIPGKVELREKMLNGGFMIFAMLGGFGIQLRGNQILDIAQSINPVMLLTDSLLALRVDNLGRYIQFISILFALTTFFLVISIIFLRRNRHADL